MAETCPHTSMTLKERAYQVLADPATIYTPEMLEMMPLEELKLETDARASVYVSAFQRSVLTEETQDILVQWLGEDDIRNLEPYTHIELADHFQEKTPVFLNALLGQFGEYFAQTESGQQFLDDFDMFRAAYFSRTPAATGKEKQYESIQTLISSGFVTGVMHIRGIMSRQDGAAIYAGLDVDQTKAMIEASPHLALLVSKLRLADEERYVEAANRGGVKNNPIRIVNGVYAFSPDIFARMRMLETPEDEQIAHRPHLHCPASVTFPDEASFNTEFWGWYNGALTKAGFWDKQKP